ncbi:MAG: 3-hydroxyacyl-ACP dehydratase FabZ family protein [Planctomycetota bacterium]
MASELLFEIADIDLSQVAIPAERVGELIPQCGAMRQLDYVIWTNESVTRGLGIKHVRSDEFWVPGHIPGRPLFPGVLMIEAGAQFCGLLHCIRAEDRRFIGFVRCNDVVFRGQVVPGDEFYLLAEEIELRRRRFVSAVQGVVNGQLVFEATITGMAM